MTAPPLPLDGITVVSCEQAIAAPLATRHLADWGARVIKVERPEGDFARGYDETVHGLSSHFVWVNRGKESVVLDLKDPASRPVLEALLDRADVFVQNLAPGAAERLGLGADELLARHPRLVCCGISGYGTTGPYRDAKAYDALIQAEAGLVSVTGTEEHPAKAGIAVADISAGMYAYSAILTALYERERTGRGARIDISLFDALVEWMGYPLAYAEYGGSAPPRTGTSHATIAPYGLLTARDGVEVMVSVQSEREWAQLCEHLLADPGLADDPRFRSSSLRVRHRGELDGLLAAAASRLTGDELEQRLGAGRIAHARMRTLDEVVAHPQLVSRGRLVDVDTPGGPVHAVLPPAVLAGRRPAMGQVPALGEHTAAVLAELGLA